MKILFVTIIAICLDFTYQADWSYEDESTWPDKCHTGRLQSPINIITKDAVIDQHDVHIRGPLRMRNYDAVHLYAHNNGHTIQFTVDPDEDQILPVLSGGPLRGNYTFHQFHLHWLSEHAIDGLKYPLEIHFLHIKEGLILEDALLRPDGLAVIGVLCQVYSGNGKEFALDQLMYAMPALKKITDDMDLAPTLKIDMRRLISPDPQSYYTYSGSLTTPNCQEVVTWIVMDKPVIISEKQYRTIRKVDVGGVTNYRSLQTANRAVYRSIPSCSAVALPGFVNIAGTFLILLSCAANTVTNVVYKTLCPVANIKRKMFGWPLYDCDLHAP